MSPKWQMGHVGCRGDGDGLQGILPCQELPALPLAQASPCHRAPDRLRHHTAFWLAIKLSVHLQRETRTNPSAETIFKKGEHGGKRIELYYVDKDGEPSLKSKAKYIKYCEVSANGRVLYEELRENI